MFIAVLFIIAPNWNRSKAHEQEKGQIQFGVPVSAILLGSRTLCRAALTTPPPPPEMKDLFPHLLGLLLEDRP